MQWNKIQFIISSSDADKSVELADSDDMSEILKRGRFVFQLSRFLYNLRLRITTIF